MRTTLSLFCLSVAENNENVSIYINEFLPLICDSVHGTLVSFYKQLDNNPSCSVFTKRLANGKIVEMRQCGGIEAVQRLVFWHSQFLLSETDSAGERVDS